MSIAGADEAPPSGESRLLELARVFADDLTQRIRSIVPTDAAFSALAYPHDNGGRVLVGVPIAQVETHRKRFRSF